MAVRKLVYDPKQIFQLAEQFHLSSLAIMTQYVRNATAPEKRLGDPSEGVIVMGKVADVEIFPSYTCAAFSLELYLKSLLTIEHGELEQGGHYLSTYFVPLSPESKVKIRLYAEERGEEATQRNQRVSDKENLGIAYPKFDFDKAMEDAERSFVKTRYAYEDNFEIGGAFTSHSIICATRRVILDRYPEWSSVDPHFQHLLGS
jgi:hypothetical protein